jgi:glycosyltransferase A (GT-A) superfamily protein (DUF2064 family)
MGPDLIALKVLIDKAINKLDDMRAFVIGPAEDGGYYLLGMKKCLPVSFVIRMGTDSVFEKIHC